MIRAAVVVSCLGFLAGLAWTGHSDRVRIAPTPVCSHGESSVMVEVRDGQVVTVSQPTVTGCNPSTKGTP